MAGASGPEVVLSDDGRDEPARLVRIRVNRSAGFNQGRPASRRHCREQRKSSATEKHGSRPWPRWTTWRATPGRS